MVKFCLAALLVVLTWLSPSAAWAGPLLAQAAPAEAATALSNADITTFAKAYQAIQTLRIKAEDEMVEAVKDAGLTVDRFNAIAETQLDGAAESAEDMAKVAAKAKISKAETKRFDAAVERIIAIRQRAEEKMETAIADTGMALDTFNGILEQSVDNLDLQRQISDEIVRQTVKDS